METLTAAAAPETPEPPVGTISSTEDLGLLTSLRTAAFALKRAGIRFALAGSFAVHARGGPLPEHDVDFFLQPQDRDAAAAALASTGLRVEQPPLDWLFKAYDGDRLVDLIHAPMRRPVDLALLDRADEMDVAALRMPVLSATDLVVYKLLTFNEHTCDFASAIPTARALREQVDWDVVAAHTAESPFAAVFLDLLGRLEITGGADD
ncbi:nucleotidyltransferase family protein [Sporichthya polymorpha]|uniref:nucleotidyltransferase family protein n=1 Tax=Sporichthya polymorpha TaxID=35751 RepID=UPI00035E4A35|nr:nucleotidyltransferase family protein [Sporichthya polymorpha]